jgi:hypothetical protein
LGHAEVDETLDGSRIRQIDLLRLVNVAATTANPQLMYFAAVWQPGYYWNDLDEFLPPSMTEQPPPFSQLWIAAPSSDVMQPGRKWFPRS